MTFKSFQDGSFAEIYAQIDALRDIRRVEACTGALIAQNTPARPVVRELTPEQKRAQKTRDLCDTFVTIHNELSNAFSWIAQPNAESFESYEISRSEQARALAISRRFAERLLTRIIDDNHASAGIIFLGTTGTGKTHLAKSILRYLKSQRMPGFFMPSMEYFDLYNSDFSRGLDYPLWKIRSWLSRTACLVIDETGVGMWTDSRKARLQQLLDLRTEQNLPTVITTNLTAKDIREGGIERLKSRFDERLYPIVCAWDDYREAHALKNLSPEEIF